MAHGPVFTWLAYGLRRLRAVGQLALAAHSMKAHYAIVDAALFLFAALICSEFLWLPLVYVAYCLGRGSWEIAPTLLFVAAEVVALVMIAALAWYIARD